MNNVEILTLIISLAVLLITYLVFKSNQSPKIIVFASPHYGKESFIKLNIINIGNGIAENVQIKSSQPIPRRAFGISKLNQPLEVFDTGIFKHGIKIMNTNQEYIYDWGQYGGLKEALDNKPITFEVSYEFKYPLSLCKSKFKDKSVIDIRELEGLPSSTGNLTEQLGKIHKEIEQLNREFRKLNK